MRSNRTLGTPRLRSAFHRPSLSTESKAALMSPSMPRLTGDQIPYGDPTIGKSQNSIHRRATGDEAGLLRTKSHVEKWLDHSPFPIMFMLRTVLLRLVIVQHLCISQ